MKLNKREVTDLYLGDRLVSQIYLGKDLAYLAYSRGLSYEYSPEAGGYIVTGRGTCNDDKIRIPIDYDDGVNGEYDVVGIGPSAFLGDDLIVSLRMSDKLISIGSDAFSQCPSLRKAVIGYGVREVGEYSFSLCTSLKKIVIPDNVTSLGERAFHQCTSIQSVVIGKGLTAIGREAFASCTELTTLTLSDQVKIIGSGAFEECTSLQDFDFPESITSIGDRAFYNCDSLTRAEIPEGVVSVGSYAFDNCSSLINISIPNSIVTIGDHAFDGYVEDREYNIYEGFNYLGNTQNKYLYLQRWQRNDISSIKISQTCKFIGSNALTSLSRVTSLEIPDSVVDIGYGAFSYCRNLSSITLGGGIKKISDQVFLSCDSLKTANYTGSLDQWAQIDFSSRASNPSSRTGGLRIGGSELTKITLNSARKISKYAFYNFSKITEVELPNNNLDEIGDYAFYSCISLVSCSKGGRYVEKLGKYAFGYCSKLTEVCTSYDYTTYCGDGAFMNCSSLKYVSIGGSRGLGIGVLYGVKPTYLALNGAKLPYDWVTYDEGGWLKSLFGNPQQPLDPSNISIPQTIATMTLKNLEVPFYGMSGYSPLKKVYLYNAALRDFCFHNCTGLDSSSSGYFDSPVIMDEETTITGGGIFYGTTLLKFITFYGKMADLAYVFGNQAETNFLAGSKVETVVCSDGDVDRVGDGI